MAETWNVRNQDNSFDKLPDVDSTIVVRYISSADRRYGIVEVKNAISQVLNNQLVDAWQYMSYFLQKRAGKNLLSGYKEGTNNDWAPTVNGFIQTEYDVYMLRQQINARLQTLPNEVDGFDGIDYINVIFGNTSVEQKAAAFVEVIQNIPSVKSVTFINATWIDKVAGTFRFTFQIQSIFGDLQFQIGLDAQNRKVLENNE